MRHLILLSALAFSACATQPKPQPLTVVRTQCLPMVEYSKAEQQKAAQELKGLPEGSQVAKMVIDYGALRKADRACQETPGY